MENEEGFVSTEISPEVLYQQDKAAVDMQVATAHQYPRNIKRATENAIAIATLDKETAETCTYSVPRGGKPITGPSVHLAKMIAQVWGNMRIQAKVVGTDKKNITSQAVAWDLESNLAIQMEIKRSIVGKNGRFSEDMITVTGNAANSIALRNAILSVVPKAVVDKVYKAAKQVITGDISDETKLIAARSKVVNALKDTYSVTEKEICEAIGKAAVTQITGDDIVVLIGIGTAIKEGDTTVDQAFRKKKDAPSEIDPKDLLNLYELKKPLLTPEEIKDAERIIFKKEVTSYAKLEKLLNSK